MPRGQHSIDLLKNWSTAVLYDHFWAYDTGDLWTTVGDGTPAVGDAAHGVLAIPSTNTDNNQTYVKSTNEVAVFAQDKPFYFGAYVQFAEANTDDANMLAGVMEGIAADSLVDNGAGPAADYDGAVFFKEDGQTLWSVEVSNGTTQQTVQLTAANSQDGVAHIAGSSAYQHLEVLFVPIGADTSKVIFRIDGSDVQTLDFDYSSTNEMNVGFGTKAGGANTETLNVDYAGFSQNIRT